MTTINPARAIQRSIEIAKLDNDMFEEVEADHSATAEAGAVLVASAVIGSIGGFFTGGVWGFLAMVLATVGGWYVWAWVSAYIAENVFDVHTTDTNEMLRVLGYGSAPRALGLIPFLGLVAAIWTCITLVMGIRAAGEMTMSGAVITAVLGLIPTMIAYALILMLL